MYLRVLNTQHVAARIDCTEAMPHWSSFGDKTNVKAAYDSGVVNTEFTINVHV